MVNILVPTDFSDLSRGSIEYAIRIANQLDGNITLLHVINIMQPTRASTRLKLHSLEREMVKDAKEDFAKLLDEVTKQVKTTQPVKYKVVKGASFNDTVKNQAKRLRTGLIIMSTRGASGLRKYVMGTNTASIIGISPVPVLAVPEEATFKSFKTVVYATDMQHLEKEIKALMPYLEKFQSHVHLIHVVPSNKDIAAIEAKIDKVIMKTGFKNVIVRMLVNENVDVAIDNYVKASKADLLTMFTHEKSFYEKLFNRSITKRMAFQSKLPLLAFRQK
ncbi:MAG: universal stress protein [Cyclobacteriaceae bacterium]|nr:universal stress protein [Cyclobacteriaceae bacterium]